MAARNAQPTRNANTRRKPGRTSPTSGKRAKKDGRAAAATDTAAAPARTPRTPQSAPAVRKPRQRSKPLPAPDVDIDQEVLDFIEAIDRFRLAHQRPFPTWSEVLHIVKSLGYRRAD